MSDLSLNPDWPVEETIQHKTLVAPSENGAEQRRSKWSAPLRQFNLKYTNRAIADWNTIKAFLLTKKGAYDTFTWTNPNDSTEYTVRFLKDSQVVKQHCFGIVDFEFSLIEVKS